MAEGFTKLHRSILTSSVWSEDYATRLVWVTMLAEADADGFVEAAIPGLARIANVTLEECEKAVERLQSPDPYSRTKDHEGRRIEPVDGGWVLLTYRKHRERASKEDRRQKAAERQRRKREREREAPSPEEPPPSRPKRDTGVTGRDGSRDGHGESRMSRQAEAEAEAEEDCSSARAVDEPEPEPPPDLTDAGLVDELCEAWAYYRPRTALPRSYLLDPMAQWVRETLIAIREQSRVDGRSPRSNCGRLLEWWFEHEFWGRQAGNLRKLAEVAPDAFADLEQSAA